MRAIWFAASNLTQLLTAACLAPPLLGIALSAGATSMFMGLGDLPGGSTFSQAFAVSADGSVVVGRSLSSASTQQPPLKLRGA